MKPIEMLEELCEKFGPVLASAKIGVDYHQVWLWRTSRATVNLLEANAIRYIYDLEFNSATRTDR